MHCGCIRDGGQVMDCTLFGCVGAAWGLRKSKMGAAPDSTLASKKALREMKNLRRVNLWRMTV